MGLRGPLPKDPSQRVNRKVPIGDIANVELEFEPGEPPRLPNSYLNEEGDKVPLLWSPLTKAWWADWVRSPQAKIFSVSDWRSLLTAAIVANKFYTTFEVKYAAELRQRESAFGATPLDRLRLRMAWLENKEKEDKHKKPEAPTSRYGDLRVAGGNHVAGA